MPGTDSGLLGLPGRHSALPGADSGLSESGRKHRSKTPFDRTKLESASFGPADSVHDYARVHTSIYIYIYIYLSLCSVFFAFFAFDRAFFGFFMEFSSCLSKKKQFFENLPPGPPGSI